MQSGQYKTADSKKPLVFSQFTHLRLRKTKLHFAPCWLDKAVLESHLELPKPDTLSFTKAWTVLCE